MQLQNNPAYSKLQKFGRSNKSKNNNILTPSDKDKNNSLIQSKQDFFTSSLNSSKTFSLKNGFSPTKDQNSRDYLDSPQTNFVKNVRFSLDATNQPQILPLTFKKNKSILKNNPRNSLSKQSSSKSISSMNSHFGSTISCLSVTQSVKDEGRICQNVSYNKIINSLKENNQKYVDDIFLPGISSLFFQKKKAKDYQNVVWARLDEIYKGKKIKLRSLDFGFKPVIAPGQFGIMKYMVTCFTALSGSPRCLERIFQNQQYTKHGVYYLRLNHQGIWKYIVIDDFIPVIKNAKGQFIPIHLNVYPNKQTGQIYVWPFLLQKAFAKMYSCYDCLQTQRVDNFMHELTGLVASTINLQGQHSDYQIRSKLSNNDNIMIAEQPINTSDYQSYHYPIFEKRQDNNTYFVFDTKVELVGEHITHLADLTNLRQDFKCIKLYKSDQTYYSLGCSIKQNKNSVSVRKLEILETTSCDLTLIQKDKKHFRNTHYQYSWNRLIVTMKEGESGYRWINGGYDNKKILSLNCTLEPGIYYIIVMVDWIGRPYEMTLNYQGNTNAKFVRETIKEHQKLLNETCSDIAQRFGVFAQISKSICCYWYVDRKNGLIIQNIHNESRREVFHRRQYNLKGKNFQILSQGLTNNKELQIFISPLSEYTFILKFINGFDEELIQSFNLGFS